MTRFRWPILVLFICLPVALLATGVPLPFLDRSSSLPRPLPVPAGDQEMAYFHTTTNATTWERFVSGVVRAQMAVPGLRVDDSAAFSDQTTGVPEVVVSRDGRPGKLRIRWYKLTTEATADRWVAALAARDRSPLAVIGGGSSDRALDLARALDRRKQWPGDRPLLLITTATADEVSVEKDGPAAEVATNLIDVYDDRSFRFCFTNRQMAESVIDFVWDHPALRPGPLPTAGAVGSGLALATNKQPEEPPQVLSVVWMDDPFSRDLRERFGDALRGKAQPDNWQVEYSIGGANGPNFYEAKAAEAIAGRVRTMAPQRSLLVLSTITQPARRIMKAIAEAEPAVRNRLVAVTGDGIPVNAVYRDGEFAWPVHAIPVPLVLFTHHNPVGWDGPDQPTPPPPGYELVPPNSTEDVLHFSELGRVVAEACFPDGGLVARADDLAAKLHTRTPPLFDRNGNRLGGTGEYIVALWPQADDAGGRPQATMEVWRRSGDRRWQHVRTVAIDQRRLKAAVAQPRDRAGRGLPPGGPGG